MKDLLLLAAKSLVRQGRRYRLLGSAVAFSFFIIALIASLLTTMVASLEEKAKLYYGGDITIRGVDEGWTMQVRDGRALRRAARELLGPGPVISERYEHRATSTMLYFGGEGLRQRLLIGIDFSLEAELFSRFNYAEGSAEGMDGTNGIIISEPIARKLKARVGDDLLLLVPNQAGLKTTATVVVRGISRDSSLFGYYTSYLDIDFIRGLVGMPPELCTLVSVFYPEGRPSKRILENLQRGLEALFPFYPLYDRQKDFWDIAAANASAPGVKYGILSLDASLDQVGQILYAINAVAVFLIAMLLGIVVLGLSGAYRIIVRERSREIGTMRAIGMKRLAVAWLFMAEAALLAAFGSIAGSLAAWIALRLLALVDLSFVPSFDIFLRGGRIDASLPAGLSVALAGLLVATAVLAVIGPARQAARVDPCEAMRSES